MADPVKKASTLRKPRKTAAKAAPETAQPAAAGTRKKAPAKAAPTRKPASHEEIALLAHRYWVERGCAHGHDEEDWLRAEQTLLGKAS